MKALTVLNLSAAVLLCLGISLGAANDQPAGQCIKLWPEVGGIESAMPYAATVQKNTKEALAGTVAHVLAYVDRPDAPGDAGFDPNPKQLLIFPTTSGRYVLRIRDLPPGLGLHGPF